MGSLDDSHRKICTAISMDISSIATYDWPEEWPELVPFLLKLISDPSNTNGGIFSINFVCSRDKFFFYYPFLYSFMRIVTRFPEAEFISIFNSSWSFEVFGSSLW